MNKFRKHSLVFFALLLAGMARQSFGDLPITVEDIFTAEDRYRLGVSTRYHNQQFELAPLGINQNRDQLALDFNGRYGLTLNTEISARTSFVYQDARTAASGELFSESASYWNNFSIGLNHRISEDAETPAFLVFGEMVAAQRASAQDSKTLYGKEFSLGAVFYRSLDPILLSGVVTTGYRRNKNIGDMQLDEGYTLRLEPQIAFVVNNDITLTGGVRWQWHDKPRVNGGAVNINTTETAIALGMGYNLGQNTTFSFQGHFPVTSNRGTSLTLELIHRIDEKLPGVSD